jgi:hypothetical protein
MRLAEDELLHLEGHLPTLGLLPHHVPAAWVLDGAGAATPWGQRSRVTGHLHRMRDAFACDQMQVLGGPAARGAA